MKMEKIDFVTAENKGINNPDDCANLSPIKTELIKSLNIAIKIASGKNNEIKRFKFIDINLFTSSSLPSSNDLFISG